MNKKSNTKKGSSVDPLGHIKFAVSDIKTSTKFYSKLFAALGFNKVSDRAWATKEGFGVWLEEAELKKPEYKFSSPGIHHFCFKATSKKEVNKVYKFLLEEETFIYDPPQHYPEYTKNYYAVFFADPDGIKLEVAYY